MKVILKLCNVLDDSAKISFGSIKSQIGHSFSTAEMANIIKLLQAMKKEKIPLGMHYDELPTDILQGNLPFFVNKEWIEWKMVPDSSRRALINAFGFGGRINDEGGADMAKKALSYMGNLKEMMIIEGAEFIAENGINEISMRKVAARCDVSHASAYRHFENKEDFIRQIVERVSKKFASYLLEGVEAAKNPDDALVQMGTKFIQFSKDHANYYELLFLSNYVMQVESTSDEQLVINGNADAFETFKKAVYKFLAYNNSADKKDITVIQLWSFIFGLSMIVNKKDLEADDAFLREVIAEMVAKFKHM
ncbi:TetR family transcriptional regulator [Listeria aquatica]|uniref:TetR/AcrR family transcriptional regulator n=1 Tax=Listeria aquatica TaxID=1494960 RepID=UPI003F6EA4CC